MLEPITKQNSGHGATVLYGYNYALESGADFIFQTDSDGQTEPLEFDSFWQNRNDYCAQIGYRRHREDGASRVSVTKVLKLVLRVIFGVNVTDANTPFRLIERNTLEKYIKYIPENFNLSNVLLTVLLVKNKEKIRFEEITFRPRQGGVNSINFRKIFKIGLQAVRDFRQIKKSLKMSGGGK
jgi:glycosyltransferase involved in cell wall biosynthesis